MSVTLDEIVTQINSLPKAERDEIRRLLDDLPLAPPNGQKGYVSPNTIWMRDQSYAYAGRYVALENGNLLATGSGYPDTLASAKKVGAIRPMITYVPREDEEAFAGGWL